MKKVFGIITITAITVLINTNKVEAKEGPGDWWSFGTAEQELVGTIPVYVNGEHVADQPIYEWDCKGWDGACE